MPVDAAYGNQDVFESLKHRVEETAEILFDPAEEVGAMIESSVPLWYPQADRSLQMPTQGTYAKGYPLGAVVHFTAGRCDRGDADAEATIRDGITKKYMYFCVSRTGKVYQTAPLNRWGWHCGQSHFTGLGDNLSNRLVGIELCAAGILKKSAQGYEPWWNTLYAADSPKRTYYPDESVRLAGKEANICEAGHYHRYTMEQEIALSDLLLWMRQNNPAVFKLDYILGHDEISPGRKNDPGGALSMFMKDLRSGVAGTLAMA